MYLFNIETRLVGPKSLVAVAPSLKKITPPLILEEPMALVNIMKWADHIDKVLSHEMTRQNDMAMHFSEPKQLLSLHDLLLAARISKHATHVYPGERGAIVTHFTCGYLSWFPIQTNQPGEKECHSLMFDKDDGHASPFDDVSKDYMMMTECFQKWKANNHEGELSDYCCEEWKQHFQNIFNSTPKE